MKEWKLTENNFNYLDKLKICKFFLEENFWTRNKYTEKFEKEFQDRFGLDQQPIFVSSGSTANTLIAMYWKDLRDKTGRNKILFPVTTWSTSVAPFIREGFEPVFCDINPNSLFVNKEDVLKKLCIHKDQVIGIFLTTVLGFTPKNNDLEALMNIARRSNINFALDNCESTLSSRGGKSILSYGLNTTSTYFSHMIQSVEGGFVFPESEEQRDYLMCLMNHGMIRFAKNSKRLRNNEVDGRFDFFCLGNNFRNSDINAFIGLLDLKRANDYINHRKEIYDHFYNQIWDCTHYHVIKREEGDVPFAIPIITLNDFGWWNLNKATHFLKIETRPIISGNLLMHTAFERFGDSSDGFKNASKIHYDGCYIGLNQGVTKKDIDNLVKILRI